jgi:hypothetical protein
VVLVLVLVLVLVEFDSLVLVLAELDSLVLVLAEWDSLVLVLAEFDSPAFGWELLLSLVLVVVLVGLPVMRTLRSSASGHLEVADLVGRQ